MVQTAVRPDHRTDAVGIGGSPRARAWTLAVACMGVGLVVASMTALNTALPNLAVATSATQAQLTWVVDGYTVALACLLLPAGAIGDRYSRRGALLAGLVIFALGSIAPAMLHSPVQIIAGRSLAGVGAAFVMPATLSLLTVAYPKEDRMKAVGLWAGTAGSGGVLGMLGSGLFLRFWDWHAIFWSLGIAALTILALACTVASSRDNTAPQVDWLGAVLIGAAVAIAVAAILEAPDRGWRDPLVWGGLVSGAVIAAVFGVVEFRRRHPLLDVRLFRDPAFATGVASIVILFGATFGFFYVGMQYVQQIMGYSPLTTASVRPVHGSAGRFLSVVVLVRTEAGPATRAVHRHPTDGGRFRQHVRTGPALDLSRVCLADIDSRHGHRNVHGTNDFGDHGSGPRRKAGRCLRRQRHVAGDGRRVGNRGGRLNPGRALFR
jgi:MFS family permease